MKTYYEVHVIHKNERVHLLLEKIPDRAAALVAAQNAYIEYSVHPNFVKVSVTETREVTFFSKYTTMTSS